MSENLHKDHRKRMKARFLKDGFDSFESHNILEMLLFYSIPRKDTNEMAHKLIQRFGSISGVLDASHEELFEIVPYNSAVHFKMISQLMHLYFGEKAEFKIGPVLDTTDKQGEFFIGRYVGHTVEQFQYVCLDDNFQILKSGVMRKGTVNSTNVDTRDLVASVLACGATNVVIAHNHPNAPAVPSNRDVIVTTFVTRALDTINTHLLDHIIVYGKTFCSMSQLEYI